ncbi:hypothetical protein BTJ40_10835 [Microbulbifer sp. A4B17]|uniref:YopT-type cysteine protease domain-containing protein n=1 Tax=Microbulbifer sp. A4B17 TaxID=359370 RepID=UPI000D52B115|nr:YopT-type cysteine protease domain-containing protein [Microbulbifer sp. A4B17]AWF81273.1 hypothetical protein BTJ40_10835 [Microbulbifer sp. A4B17]
MNFFTATNKPGRRFFKFADQNNVAVSHGHKSGICFGLCVEWILEQAAEYYSQQYIKSAERTAARMASNYSSFKDIAVQITNAQEASKEAFENLVSATFRKFSLTPHADLEVCFTSNQIASAVCNHSKKGYFIIGLYDKVNSADDFGSGHAIAVDAYEYSIFDPNVGEAYFEDLETLWNVVNTWISEEYSQYKLPYPTSITRVTSPNNW